MREEPVSVYMIKSRQWFVRVGIWTYAELCWPPWNSRTGLIRLGLWWPSSLNAISQAIGTLGVDTWVRIFITWIYIYICMVKSLALAFPFPTHLIATGHWLPLWYSLQALCALECPIASLLAFLVLCLFVPVASLFFFYPASQLPNNDTETLKLWMLGL